MTERKIGPFILGKQIGVGGMGVVYMATYVETGKEVALKVLPPGLATDPKMLQRFEREIGILKRLVHPNIVKYYGGGTHQGQRWYAMEFIDGGSLQDILKKRKRLAWDQAIQVGRQLCAALEVAHNAGIIHRDLKPANLFVSKKGRIKLGDFGIARDTEATALTAAGKTVGTYAYMAPEQIQGNVPISKKTDLYAAGCLLYEVLTGQTPFLADNPAEMLMQHLNDDPYNVRDKIPECPLALDSLIERMLAKNPDDRPYDALAVHTELTEILEKAQEVVSEVSPQALAASGASASATVDPSTGEVKIKKKKKKRDHTEFYEKTWFLGTCLGILIALGTWLALGPNEDALYLRAKEAMAQDNNDSVVKFDDAKRLYLLPYLEKYPEGKHSDEVGRWLNEAEVEILEAQVQSKARGKRDGRNRYEKMCITAVQAERDNERNLLESIELFQSMINTLNENATQTATATVAQESAAASSGEVAGDPKYWRMLADRHLAAQKKALLSHPERNRIITERMTTAEKLLASEKPEEAHQIFALFRSVFRAETELDPWLDYAKTRLEGGPAEMPE
jgi:eukaryotic-like serine/threonine-protein kinase